MAARGMNGGGASAMVVEVGEEEEELEVEEMEMEWDDWVSDEEEASVDYLCLFCELRFPSSDDLFGHCKSSHYFDFRAVVRDAGLDIYGSIKLINYIRSQVVENKCWSCGVTSQSKKDLQDHLHEEIGYEKDGFPWDNDLYLKPFLLDDTLLHGFLNDEDEEDDIASINKEELMRDLISIEELNHVAEIYNDNRSVADILGLKVDALNGVANKNFSVEKITDHFEKIKVNNTVVEEGAQALHSKPEDKRVPFANIAAKEIKNVNDNYFGAYGSFGIHREMISDKVRTDAYREAILNNPSLMSRATVMDVGCGTGILSLFAAQAGASQVIAVEASQKMATVATQIAKDNGLLLDENQKGRDHSSAVINVVNCMVEELDKVTQVPSQSIDVLVSEWMGYCLLYESMLSSVIHARDCWLKPGGAVLPDTATIFVAGFGKGGTSLPFWEDVYGFNMSCIGKEVVEDAARFPIVDIVDSKDIVTESAVLQSFDLATMTADEMDFSANCELVLKSDVGDSTDVKSGTSWCYGIVLWFETGFTSRFCKDMPSNLSTSPYSPKTHWSQTIFTFQEPIAMTWSEFKSDVAAAIGTESCPAARIMSRISITRSSAHRSIDISLETSGISLDGRKRTWPAQIFNL